MSAEVGLTQVTIPRLSLGAGRTVFSLSVIRWHAGCRAVAEAVQVNLLKLDSRKCKRVDCHGDVVSGRVRAASLLAAGVVFEAEQAVVFLTRPSITSDPAQLASSDAVSSNQTASESL